MPGIRLLIALRPPVSDLPALRLARLSPPPPWSEGQGNLPPTHGSGEVLPKFRFGLSSPQIGEFSKSLPVFLQRKKERCLTEILL